MENKASLNEKVLSPEDIFAIVKDYIDEGIYQYALLLDGEWGCGKSHFVKTLLADQIKKCGREFIYLSLYGISSLDSLRTVVVNSYYAATKPNLNKAAKVISALSPALSILPFGLGEAATGIKENVKEHLVEHFVDLEKCFFVFDDLERCSFPINDVLGYINNLIEHNNCKVLIVANEAECGHISVQSNSEMQMIAAAMLKEHIQIEDPPRDNIWANHQTKRSLELGDIRELADNLFGQNELYKATKEKLIGKTIKYVPHLETIIPDIVNKVFVGRIEDIQEMKAQLVNTCIIAMRSEGVINLRILQYSLSYIKKICHIVFTNCKDMDICTATLCDVLNSILVVSIRSRMKNGDNTWCIDWKANEAYDTISCLSEEATKKVAVSNNAYARLFLAHFFSFRFVHHYIQSGVIDYEEVKCDLTAYINRKADEKQLANDPFTIATMGWWELSDEELLDNIEKMEKKFLNNEYPAHLCIKAIYMLMQYSQELEIEVGHPEMLFTHLKDATAKGIIPIDIEYDNFHMLTLGLGELSGVYKDQYQRYISELQSMVKGNKDTEFGTDVNCFDTINWSSVLYDKMITKNLKQEFLTRKSFLAILDVDTLLQKLKSATGTDYRNLLEIFRYVYYFSNLGGYYSADIPNLEKLIGGMREMTSGDRMIRRCRKYVRQFLEEKLADIKN